MTITIKDVEKALSHTIFGIPPKDVFLLDGIIDVEKEGSIKVAIAMQRDGSSVFTPMSRIDSIFHETIHHAGLLGFGIIRGELAADLGGRLLALKYQLFPGIKKRDVKYQEVSVESAEPILRQLGLEPMFEGMPVIRHYRLVY